MDIFILYKNDYLRKIDFFYVPDVNKFIIETFKLYGIKKNQLILLIKTILRNHPLRIL